MDEAVTLAEKIASQRDGCCHFSSRNPANPEAHFRSTGPEIWTDTGGEVDAFVCGVGTGGTITGVAPLPEGPGFRRPIYAVEPASSPVLFSWRPTWPHRIQGIGAGFVPEVLDMDLVDEVIPVMTTTRFALPTTCLDGGHPAVFFGRRQRSRRPRAGRKGRNWLAVASSP